jgi:hypothetical protein
MHHVEWWLETNISEDRAASIFMIEDFFLMLIMTIIIITKCSFTFYV